MKIQGGFNIGSNYEVFVKKILKQSQCDQCYFLISLDGERGKVYEDIMGLDLDR